MLHATLHQKVHLNKMKKAKEEKIESGKEILPSECNDENCNIHGTLKARGRFFEGKVTKKLNKRITIEFERMIYVRKYERYARSKTKIHAKLPSCRDKEANIGDIVQVQECRPLSKIIHFVFIKKIKSGDEK